MGRTHRARASVKLLAAGIAGLLSLAVFAGCTPETAAEIKTYTGINAIRQQHGLPPLKVDASLATIARQRSRDMAAKGYFSHNPPDGCNYVCLMQASRVPYSYAGENIAWNTWGWDETADVAVRMWKDSPGHMANIVNCHYERFGAGVARAANGRIYYTMIFDGNVRC